jgi:hypothetical protein
VAASEKAHLRCALRGPTEMQSYLNDPQATQEIKKYDWGTTPVISAIATRTTISTSPIASVT